MAVPNFDFAAAFYDPLARLVFGRTLLRAQQAVLRHGLPNTDAGRLLFIGGGTGQVLPELLTLRPMVQVVYVEASAAMLRRAEQHLRQSAPEQVARVQFVHGTEADLPPDARFDAILAFFLFDLFTPTELAELLHRLQQHATPKTQWLVADFAPPQRPWQRGLQWLMYQFFRRASGVSGRELPDIAGALQEIGLTRRWRQQWASGLVEAAVYSAE
ncbi:class I SAM-dependent methyltransferase [Hymenobacter koreensis]|uniref:Methyltransferase type 12 domain-containing protein n=1 Tax=Hymenobacter koreensis TaxID=1084523 RepID=A0ABP8IUT7_9BACT